MTGKQLKMWSRETVRRNRIEPAETENLPNSQKCLITLHIVGWVINIVVTENDFHILKNNNKIDVHIKHQSRERLDEI